MKRSVFKNFKKLSAGAAREPQAQAALPNRISLGANGYRAAEWSPDRAYVYFPELDPRLEMTSYTHLQLLKKARWLYTNIGLARRIVNGLAGFVCGGGLRPIPDTSDISFNEEATRLFNAWAYTPGVFDVAGKFNFFTMQKKMYAHMLRDGDIFAVFAKAASGAPQMAFYTADKVGPYQCDKNTINGVYLNARGRALWYNFYDKITGKAKQLGARNVIHFGNFDSFGAARGTSAFVHAINNMLDITETQDYVKLGIKAASAVAYVVTTEGARAAPASGLAAALTEKVEVKDSEGKSYTVDQFTGGGSIPQLPSGQDIKMINDSRPHPNQQSFFDNLVRDISWGVNISPDILWNIEKAGGVGIRYAMSELQSFINDEQTRFKTSVLWRIYCYFIASKIEQGELKPPKGGEWWRVNWLAPARQTIDVGREGKTYSDMRSKNHITDDEFCRIRGKDWRSEARQRILEEKYKRELCAESGLSYAEVFGEKQNLTQTLEVANSNE